MVALEEIMSGKILSSFFAAGIIAVGAFPAHSQQPTLPEGPGKDIVENVCTGCHQLPRIMGFGYKPEDWHNFISMMLNIGVPVPPDQVSVVTDYLIKNFPEKPAPAPVIIPGTAKVTIKEWKVPTPGSRPHDPMAGKDGSLWYSGQFANVLGRLDPKTGVIKEYKLPPNSGPHGIISGPDGNVWYTANFGAYIGRFDPKTGDVTKFPMPDPKAKDPHTLQFDKQGVLWFTVQGANMVGRLDPKTGQIKLVTSPTEKSLPYGMVINSKGVPFFDEFGANKIASIDPATMQIREYPLPNPDARPRRIAKTSDDIIWYSDYGRGYLGRLDPKTGAVTERASPGGPKSLPYGIAVVHDIIWYSESGVKPNTLVRFDPKTAKFQTWTIPGGGGVVRNMVPTRDGKGLALACSGVNGVALVTIN